MNQLKVGGRVLRAGQRIKIRGERGHFKIIAFNPSASTVSVYGGRPGGPQLMRTFMLDRIGTRPRALNEAR